ncbi:MAG: ATP-binding protein [Lautropia sp.]
MTRPADAASTAARPGIWLRVRHSLHLRLLASMLALILLGVSILAIAAYRRALDDADTLLDGQMRQLARAIATGLPLNVDPQAPSSIADLQNTDYVVQVWSIDGRRVFSSQPRVLMPDRAIFGFSDWSAGDDTWRMYAVQDGARVIQVAQDLDVRRRIAGDLAWRTVLPILLWLPILLAGTAWVVARSLSPLARVRAQLAQRKVADLAPIDDAEVPQEIRPVVVELNLLLARLRTAFDAQRDFVADAAHELRTPLAALRLQLQHLARLEPPARDDPRGVALERLAQGIERASRLVEQLLALAREDSATRDTAIPSAGPVDLNAIAARVVDECAPVADAREVDLGLVGAGACPLVGDEPALAILVRNLVDNAIKHSPRGGTVDVATTCNGGAAVLVVEDAGPGIDPQARERVFDRFFRLDAAPGDATTGSGLGLAIVKSIASRHAASIRLDASARLGGLRVEVRFPDRAAGA